MNDKQARSKLKKISEGAYRNSRREKNERHQIMNDTLNEIKKIEDTRRSR